MACVSINVNRNFVIDLIEYIDNLEKSWLFQTEMNANQMKHSGSCAIVHRLIKKMIEN